MKKNIIARMKVDVINVSQFIKHIEILLPKTRNEIGNLEYSMFQKVENNDDVEFLFYELYQDEEALKIHNTSNHVSGFIKDAIPLLSENPKIEMYSI